MTLTLLTRSTEASEWMALQKPACPLLRDIDTHLVEDEGLWDGTPVSLTWGGEQVKDDNQNKAHHNRRGCIDAINEEHHHQCSNKAKKRSVPREILEWWPATYRWQRMRWWGRKNKHMTIRICVTDRTKIRNKRSRTRKGRDKKVKGEVKNERDMDHVDDVQENSSQTWSLGQTPAPSQGMPDWWRGMTAGTVLSLSGQWY